MVWVAIGVIGSLNLILLSLVVFLMLRLREIELFIIVISGVVMGRSTTADIAAYLKSRSDHPAGKKGDRLPRRMDDKGTA